MHAVLLYTLIGLSIKRASSFLTLQPTLISAPLSRCYDNSVSSTKISSTSTDSTTSSSIDSTATSSTKDNDNIIRPLTQNWWPVSLLTALDISKPNAIELLGKKKKLVLWYDISKEEVS